MNRSNLPLLLSVLTLLAWLPASASVRQADMKFNCASPAAAPTLAEDYLFYHGLVSPHAPKLGQPAPHPQCNRSKVIRT
jgi:hypothetical protein